MIFATHRGGPRDSAAFRSAANGPVVDWRLLVAGVLFGAMAVAGLFVAFGPSLAGRAPEAPPADVPVRPALQATAKDSRPKDSGGTIARIEATPMPSKPAQAEMRPVATPAVPSPEEVAAEAERQKADATAREAEAGKAARLQAFRDLKARLEDDGHLPLKADVNLESREEQSLALCELGPAEVGVGLPPRLTAFGIDAAQPQWNLECQGEPGGPWVITLKNSDQTFEIAKVEVQDQGEGRMLSLWLLQMPADKDRLWVAGRQALTTAPLVLRLPGSPLAASPQPAADTETFVQLCTPTRLAPLRFEKLLTDKNWLPSGKAPGESLENQPLPATPWPLRVKLVGRGPDGITAAVLAKSPDPRATAVQPQSPPLVLTATWVWSGEQDKPFMKTTFALQHRGDGPDAEVADVSGEAFEIRLIDSKVLPPWNGWQRLRDLKEAGADSPPPLAQLPPAPPSFLKLGASLADDIPIGIFASYSDIARRYVPRLTHREVQGWLAGPAGQVVKVGPEDWRQIIRARLRTSQGFGNWVRRVAPPPPPDDTSYENGVYIPTSERTVRQERFTRYAEAGPEVVQEYWDSLKAVASRRGAEREEVILCCLHFEFEPVLEGKRKTKQLLEAVGDGTVELTGRVSAVPTTAGHYAAVLAEFGLPAVRAATLPSHTPPPLTVC